MITITPTSFPAAVRYVTSLTGASEEDAEKVVRAVAAFAVAQYMAEQASQPPIPPAPQGVTMEQVKAYVDGRLEGIDISPLERAAARASRVLSALPDPDELQARFDAEREAGS